MSDELWHAELAGDVTEFPREILASRGRLVLRVEAWTPEVGDEFRRACVQRAREHAARSGGALDRFADSATTFLDRIQTLTPWVTAHTAGLLRELTESGGYDEGFARERELQSAWLAERLGLGPSD